LSFGFPVSLSTRNSFNVSQPPFLSDSDVGDYFSNSQTAAKSLADLERKIVSYNNSLSSGMQAIPSLSNVSERKVPQALTDFIQAQMIVLQNQTASALAK
jgi:hypothetical protein